MKTKTIAVFAALSLIPLAGFAQTPPTPPAPPAPAVPPNPRGDRDRDRMEKVPVTYLGVETSDVPSVVAEQLGLAKGFGLVVDYVVPDGPAAAAGVQANDILKMFNDQILTEPDQLAKLVRSNAEGTSVTLTVLRKGAETKLTAKLGKREVTQRRGRFFHGRHGENFGDLNLRMQDLGERLGQMNFGALGDVVGDTREQIREAREEARRAAEEGRRAAREGLRVAEASRRAAGQMSLFSRDNGGMSTTKIDLGKAQIVYHDDKGEMKIETVDNKKVLTAKDPQGKLLFSGPVSTKEELDKVPAEVRQRYEKLEQKDLPAISPKANAEENDADDEGDDDNDADDNDDNSSDAGGVQQVIAHPEHSFPAQRLGINNVLI